MARGHKRKPKNIRLQRQGPRVEAEAVATGDDGPTADHPARLQPPARGRRNASQRDPRSPGAGRDNTPPPGNSRARPDQSRYSHNTQGLYGRNGSSAFRPARQPHRHPPASQATSCPIRLGPLHPSQLACAACAIIRTANSRLYGGLLAGMRRDRALLDEWADDVGIGDGSTIEEMEWQPEPTTIVVPAERRLSDMRRIVFASDRCYAVMAGCDGGGAAAATAAPELGSWGARPVPLGMGIGMGIGMPTSVPNTEASGMMMHTCREYGHGAVQGHGHTQSDAARRNGSIAPPPQHSNPPPSASLAVPRMRVGSASGYESGGALMAATEPGLSPAGRNTSILPPGNTGLGSTAGSFSSLARCSNTAASDAFAVAPEPRPVMEGMSMEVGGDMKQRLMDISGSEEDEVT